MTEVKRKTNAENSSATIDSIVGWLKFMSVAFALAFCMLLFVGYLARRDFQEQRNRDNAQDATQLQARIVESCLNYNRDQTADRLDAHENIFALTRLSGRSVDEVLMIPGFSERLDVYDKEIAVRNSYRRCDPACAVSYINKDIPDCPPSDNEEGT